MKLSDADTDFIFVHIHSVCNCDWGVLLLRGRQVKDGTGDGRSGRLRPDFWPKTWKIQHHSTKRRSRG